MSSHACRGAVVLVSERRGANELGERVDASEIEDQNESVREFQRTHPPKPDTSTPSIAPASENKEMSRGTQTAWILGTLMVIGTVGLYFATRMDPVERNAECQTLFGMDQECVVENAAASLRGYELPAGEVDPLAPEPITDPASDVEAAVDAAQAAAEAAVGDAQADFDSTMNDLGTARSYAPADPELEMGSRHAVELNEMICRETGQNCDVAKMARRHHIERYGRF